MSLRILLGFPRLCWRKRSQKKELRPRQTVILLDACRSCISQEREDRIRNAANWNRKTLTARGRNPHNQHERLRGSRSRAWAVGTRFHVTCHQMFPALDLGKAGVNGEPRWAGTGHFGHAWRHAVTVHEIIDPQSGRTWSVVHLDVSQRAVIAAEIGKTRVGKP